MQYYEWFATGVELIENKRPEMSAAVSCRSFFLSASSVSGERRRTFATAGLSLSDTETLRESKAAMPHGIAFVACPRGSPNGPDQVGWRWCEPDVKRTAHGLSPQS